MLATVVASFFGLAVTGLAQPLRAENGPDEPGSFVESVPPALGPMVAVPPARFAGWFQPWVVALLVGLPLLAAALERRQDLTRWARRRDWQKRSGPQ